MKDYVPLFTITSKMVDYISNIMEKIGKLDNYANFNKMPSLRKNNRIRSIHSSLAIEANSLSLNQVKDVIMGKRVIGPKNEIKEFHPGQVADINVNGEVLGVVGRIHPQISKEPVFVLEINLTKLLAKKTGKMKFKEISIYPEIKKDIAIIVDKNISSEEIAKTIKSSAGKLLINSEVFDVYMGANLPEGKKSIAYALTFGASDRTLTDEEVNPVLDKIVAGVEKAFGAELRK
mgnify:CR=1 FL=1